MAYTRGRCTNFDYCSIAESRRDVEVRVGEDFICPECGKPLKAPQLKQGAGSPLVPALIGAGVLVLVGGAVFLGMRMGGGGAGPAVTATPAPAPVRPAPQQSAAIVPAAKPPAAPAENVLARVHGARAYGADIVAPLAAAYLAQIGDTAVESTTAGGEIHVSGLRSGVRETIVIAGDGAAAGLADLGRGAADVVVSPRRILPAEQTALAPLGDMTAPAAEHVLALDAEAVVVNPGNSVASLTRTQVADLLGGQTRTWAALGGPAGPVDIYAATPAAGTEAPAGLNPAGAPGAKLLADPQAVSHAVVADPQGVGLVDLAAIGQARVVPIAETGAAPANPTNQATIVAGDYPLAYRVYLYTSPKAEGGFAQRFVEYALSAPGQALVEQHGLVSPTLKPAAPAVAEPVTEADKLKAFVAGAKRLAITFRFEPNSTVLDQYGERDLDRVMNYLVSIHDSGDHLLLAGFADNQGDPASNVEVSKKRADAVAALFVRRGITPGKVAGFGAELPVADNGTEAGREKNRRVEVYIRP